MLPRLSHLLFALGTLSMGMTLSACKKPEYPLCKKDKHCVAERGEKCVEGTCQNCKADTDCAGMGPNGEQWKCHEFLCQDPATIPADAGGGADGLGAPCTQSIECMGGLVCKAGACAPCSEDFDCQPGTCNMGTGRCDSPGGDGGGGGQCETDDQCAMDEICDGGMCVFSGGYQDGGANPCSIDAVYFEFDSPQLKPETQEQLKQLAECMKTQGGKLTILEAHADARGTEEYNIMLTDRRGQAVKEYLENLGVDPSMMQVISKGDLEATGTDDATMGKDRRVQFIWQ
ncbi:MAG: OmpA family protein [Myxococcales bacterium]|nr:OmpA family protein [Myxococcales bacterium]